MSLQIPFWQPEGLPDPREDATYFIRLSGGLLKANIPIGPSAVGHDL
jgi:hypothetical protein